MQKLLIAFIFLFCYAGSCHQNPFVESTYRIWIENKANKAITFLVGKYYPDTTLPDEEDELCGVVPNSKSPYDFYERKWSDVFENLPADTLSIFIFSGDTLAAYSWQQVRSGYKILKRYDLSRQDIEAMNYTITYP